MSLCSTHLWIKVSGLTPGLSRGPHKALEQVSMSSGCYLEFLRRFVALKILVLRTPKQPRGRGSPIRPVQGYDH